MMEINEEYLSHFKNYTVKDTAFWESAGEIIELPKNYVLLEADEYVSYCYYIKKGMVVSFEYTESGEERIYHLTNDGMLLLESSLLMKQKVSVSFKTLVPSILVRISYDKLMEIIKTNSDAAIDIIISVGCKHNEANNQLREVANHSALWKISNLLLSFASAYGVDYEKKILISLKISQQLIASMLRMNRVTVTNVMSELKNKGLIEIVNGHYCIKNPSKLLTYANNFDARYCQND